MPPGSDNRKKIAFILPQLNPGGAERVLVTLLNNLDRSRYAPEFIVLGDEGTARGWIDAKIPFHALNRKRTLASLPALYARLKKLRPDVVVTTMVHTNAVAIMLKPFFPGTRFIIRESSLPMALIGEYGWKGRLCKPIYKYLYPYADLVISPTRQITDEFRDILKIDIENHKILFNPVDEQRLRRKIPAEFRKDLPACVRYVCVGRLGFEKGYDRLIESLAAFKPNSGMDWRLDIIGDGAERQNLARLISEHKLGDHVFLTGYNDAPWSVVAQADCLLLPSRWEGMPNVALEALSCGTKVIAHKDAGGISEIAALAAGTVEIAGSMEEFAALMAKVSPLAKSTCAASLLPAAFALDTVMREFENML